MNTPKQPILLTEISVKVNLKKELMKTVNFIGYIREIQLRGEDSSCMQPLQQPSTIVMQMSSYLYTSTQLSMCGALHLITATCHSLHP